MTRIYLETQINAPIKKVFDLARSIDFHIQSASQTNEKAISGRTSGLITLGETVTWRGKHFGLHLTHKSKITDFNSPVCFTDEMVTGHFKSFKHQHIFAKSKSGTLMIDILEHETPYRILGTIFNKLILKRYLSKFLTIRNLSLQQYAERSIVTL